MTGEKKKTEKRLLFFRGIQPDRLPGNKIRQVGIRLECLLEAACWPLHILDVSSNNYIESDSSLPPVTSVIPLPGASKGRATMCGSNDAFLTQLLAACRLHSYLSVCFWAPWWETYWHCFSRKSQTKSFKPWVSNLLACLGHTGWAGIV